MEMKQEELMSQLNQEEAEAQLLEVQKTINFYITEYPIEVLVDKMPSTLDEDDGEFVIPTYQRKFTWEQNRRCKFIESVLMGLPIPFLFGYFDPEREDRTVIVDGVQRLSTLKAFIKENLQLEGLDKLDKLEGFRFSDLSTLQQRRLNRRALRMVVLDNADPETQFELFERINTGSKAPSPAEIRRGAYIGPFRDLVIEFAEDPTFIELTPMGETKVDQREREELVARLFCYADKYLDFKHDVSRFVNEYFKNQNTAITENPTLANGIRAEFTEFCEEAKAVLPDGDFSARGKQTPRNRFEALAVGILLSIRKNGRGLPVMDWLSEDEEFREIVKSGGSNSSIKLQQRIEYVVDKLC
ncbi:MAG: DUF262 domain-containing protein [Verrucomicrobiota bacterium]